MKNALNIILLIALAFVNGYLLRTVWRYIRWHGVSLFPVVVFIVLLLCFIAMLVYVVLAVWGVRGLPPLSL